MSQYGLPKGAGEASRDDKQESKEPVEPARRVQ